jgi:hypothetical protein
MGTKRNGVPCYDKAGEDEELFTLRAQDESSPKTVLFWIGENFETCNEDKLREAFECALRMKAHPNRKAAG